MSTTGTVTRIFSVLLVLAGSALASPVVGRDPFIIFLRDCCNKADANHQSHGSLALLNSVSGDKKAAANVEKLSTPTNNDKANVEKQNVARCMRNLLLRIS
ncbi:hypothetical protein B0H13DRAFT_1866867 [Mycena leptocephala]|nr:hypothetical protein B0H13DRAFT_1866867 [Mycena leptocephala]